MEKNQKRRRSSNFLIFADQLTSALNSAVKNRNSATGGMLSSTYSAKKLAKKLFEGLDKDRGGVITPDEFEPYFKKSSDAAMAFKLFDQDGNGDIDRKEMRNAVVRIYKERRALSKGLKVCILDTQILKFIQSMTERCPIC
jgi:Ca2+-binding EF-hand superfamily protein